jgi:hypothetical protein
MVFLPHTFVVSSYDCALLSMIKSLNALGFYVFIFGHLFCALYERSM